MRGTHLYLCECGGSACNLQVRLRIKDYVRASKVGFVVHPYHADAAGWIVERHAEYAIVLASEAEREASGMDEADADGACPEGVPVCAMCWSELTAADAQGLCLHCHWVVRGEIEVGLREITDYLAKVTKFEQWCANREAEKRARRYAQRRARDVAA